MKKRINRKIFARFYHGIATRREKQAIFNSRDSEEMLKEKWEDYTDLVDEGTHTAPDFGQLYQSIQRYQANSDTNAGGNVFAGRWMQYAAAVVLAFMLLGSMLYFTGNMDFLSGTVAMVEKSNERGQRSAITLPDGSRVWLNASSSIRYPKQFKGNLRLVELEGEAFFDVVHHARKPFHVKVEDLTVQVLGTAFNVKAYPDENNIQTTLLRGKVGLVPKHQTDQPRIVLRPNQQANYQKSSHTIALEEVNAQRYALWTKGRIAFDNTPLREMIPTMERWFDVDFVVNNAELLDERYTITLTDESVNDFLLLLEKTTEVTYTIDQHTIYLERE